MTSPSLTVGSGGSKRGAFCDLAPANKAKPAKISRQLAIALRNEKLLWVFSEEDPLFYNLSCAPLVLVTRKLVTGADIKTASETAHGRQT